MKGRFAKSPMNYPDQETTFAAIFPRKKKAPTTKGQMIGRAGLEPATKGL